MTVYYIGTYCTLFSFSGFNTTWRLNDNQEATYTVIRNEILLDDGIIYIECQMPADQVFIKAMTKSRLEDRLERMLRRGTCLHYFSIPTVPSFTEL